MKTSAYLHHIYCFFKYIIIIILTIIEAIIIERKEEQKENNIQQTTINKLSQASRQNKIFTNKEFYITSIPVALFAANIPNILSLVLSERP